MGSHVILLTSAHLPAHWCLQGPPQVFAYLYIYICIYAYTYMRKPWMIHTACRTGIRTLRSVYGTQPLNAMSLGTCCMRARMYIHTGTCAQTRSHTHVYVSMLQPISKCTHGDSVIPRLVFLFVLTVAKLRIGHGRQRMATVLWLILPSQLTAVIDARAIVVCLRSEAALQHNLFIALPCGVLRQWWPYTT
jgi:hypothetical protein